MGGPLYCQNGVDPFSDKPRYTLYGIHSLNPRCSRSQAVGEELDGPFSEAGAQKFKRKGKKFKTPKSRGQKFQDKPLRFYPKPESRKVKPTRSRLLSGLVGHENDTMKSDIARRSEPKKHSSTHLMISDIMEWIDEVTNGEISGTD